MPYIKSNVHTHTTFCDGKDTMEDMVLAAIVRGFDTLGFSFHSYTAFDPTYCIRDYYEYMREFERLKRKYADQIYLLNGVELDYFGERPAVCDYTIGSVHYLSERGRYLPIDHSADIFRKLVSEFYAGDVYAACEKFYSQVAAMAAEVNPDVYGHFDYITCYNSDGSLFNEADPRYMRAALSAIEALPAGAVIEVNLGRLYRGKGDIYPSPRLIPLMYERGCRFMLSSDAHQTDALGFGFDATCKRLKDLGVKSLVRYKGTELVEEGL